MNTKLYVDNLAAAITGCDLMNMFSAHGNVAGISLPVDHENGRSRGFGFVTMATPEGARAAVRALHGKQIGTRTLTVSESWPQEERSELSDEGNRPAVQTETLRCHIMNFTDPQLQKCYEESFTDGGSISDGQRQISALIGMHDMFQLLEGPHSPRVHELIGQLLLPKLRPGLRCRYQRSGADEDHTAVALRDHLSQLAGEKLESATGIPLNPS